MHASTRARLIEQLTREIQVLKDELESFRLEVKRAQTSSSQTTGERHPKPDLAPSLWSPFQSDQICRALKGRISELEAELAEQSHLRLQAAGESEFLKAELEELRRVREDTEKEHRSVTEIESKSGLFTSCHLLLRS